MTGDFAAGSTFYFVVAPGQIEGFSINVETKEGSYYSNSASKGKINVTAGSLTRLGQISFKAGAVTASADHTYDESGNLIGSSLTVNHGIPQNMWKDVTNLSVTVTKGGTTYREFSASSITSTSVTPLGKTYLPQGSYDVNVEYTMNGVATSAAGKVIVPQPDKLKLTITSVEATTSYSLAEKGGSYVDQANSHEPEKITSPKCTFAGISTAVLDELKPTCSFSVSGQTNQGTVSGTSGSCGEFSGLSWGTHTLSATVTFDGVSSSATTTCHITGLPYKSTNFMEEAPTFTSTNEVEKWIKQGTTKQQGGRGYQIYYYYNYLFGTTKETGNIFSPAVQIPTGSIPISYKVGINFYTSGAGTGQTVDIHTGATTNLSKVKTNVKNITRGTSYNNKVTEISGDDTMYNNSRISISHNEAGLSKNAAENWVLVTYLHIDYRK